MCLSKKKRAAMKLFKETYDKVLQEAKGLYGCDDKSFDAEYFLASALSIVDHHEPNPYFILVAKDYAEMADKAIENENSLKVDNERLTDSIKRKNKLISIFHDSNKVLLDRLMNMKTIIKAVDSIKQYWLNDEDTIQWLRKRLFISWSNTITYIEALEKIQQLQIKITKIQNWSNIADLNANEEMLDELDKILAE